MIGQNFPVNEYYRDHILDAETISRGGRWWTAVLLIRDPKTEQPFIALYRWESTKSGWKTRKKFFFRRIEQVKSIMHVVEKFSNKLSEEDSKS